MKKLRSEAPVPNVDAEWLTTEGFKRKVPKPQNNFVPVSRLQQQRMDSFFAPANKNAGKLSDDATIGLSSETAMCHPLSEFMKGPTSPPAKARYATATYTPSSSKGITKTEAPKTTVHSAPIPLAPKAPTHSTTKTPIYSVLKTSVHSATKTPIYSAPKTPIYAAPKTSIHAAPKSSIHAAPKASIPSAPKAIPATQKNSIPSVPKTSIPSTVKTPTPSATYTPSSSTRTYKTLGKGKLSLNFKQGIPITTYTPSTSVDTQISPEEKPKTGTDIYSLKIEPGSTRTYKTLGKGKMNMNLKPSIPTPALDTTANLKGDFNNGIAPSAKKISTTPEDMSGDVKVPEKKRARSMSKFSMDDDDVSVELELDAFDINNISDDEILEGLNFTIPEEDASLINCLLFSIGSQDSNSDNLDFDLFSDL